jgi:hypothetical protein
MDADTHTHTSALAMSIAMTPSPIIDDLSTDTTTDGMES